MAIQRIHPRAKDRPYLQVGGTYGPGQEHEAEVECSRFMMPCDPGNGPGWDRDCKKDDYAKLTFVVTHDEFGRITLDTWQPLSENSGSRLLEFLVNLGVSVDNEGNFDDNDVAPRKCALEVSDPRQGDDGRWYNGNIRNVIGLE